jgi:hypothetical protein
MTPELKNALALIKTELEKSKKYNFNEMTFDELTTLMYSISSHLDYKTVGSGIELTEEEINVNKRHPGLIEERSSAIPTKIANKMAEDLNWTINNCYFIAAHIKPFVSKNKWYSSLDKKV